MPVSATVAGASQVDMLVATTRKRADPAEMFSGDRGPDLVLRQYHRLDPAAERPADRRGAVAAAGAGQPGHGFRDAQGRRDRPQPGARLVPPQPADRPQAAGAGLHPRLQQPLRRCGLPLRADRARLRAPVVPMLFTWPSRGSVLAYGYDRESTTYSRNALESLLKAISRDPAVGEISILAHSMGNSLALETLRQMAIRDGRVAPKIRNVLLAAPDVDVDLAREAIVDMGPKPNRPAFTLFVSQDDRALAVSRRVWGSDARLGAINPDQEPYRTELEQANITVLDLTKLKAGDALNHGKFAESPEVVQLIGKRLAEGQTVTDSRVGLGDRIIQVTAGAATAVGTAAGLAISAPVAVIDPQTRQNLGAHTEELARSVSGAASP